MHRRRLGLLVTVALAVTGGLLGIHRAADAPAYAATIASPGAASGSAQPVDAFGAASTSASGAPPSAGASSARPVRFGCYEQKPQEFLVRSTYIPVGRYRAAHDRAVRYRSAEYGGIADLTPPGASTRLVTEELRLTSFMGVAVKMHRRVLPALRCVEREIEATCGLGYKPAILSGSRAKNTFRGGEITNHMFGIAIDVDPHLNSCCNCVGKWRDNPRCVNAGAPIEERMVMPRCWVDAFERFGFYWLGHDTLQDTMHFEFLGDPASIE